MRAARLMHKFVNAIPEKLEEGIVYIALDYRTMIHKCCCGCGNEVVTPLGPTDWKLTFDGVSISLYPSVGNWSLDCRSHYWVDHGAVTWAGQWSDAEVAAGRAHDRGLKERYYTPHASGEPSATTNVTPPESPQTGFGAWLKRWRPW